MVLTPVMRRLLERGGPVTEFSQSMLVGVPAGAGLADLGRALQAVIDHHDMLRAWLEDHGGWRLVVPPPGPAAAGLVRRVDAAGVDAAGLGRLAAAEQAAAAARLDPAAGVMVQASWLDRGPGRPGCWCWWSITWWWTGCRGGSGPGPGCRVGGRYRRAAVVLTRWGPRSAAGPSCWPKRPGRTRRQQSWPGGSRCSMPGTRCWDRGRWGRRIRPGGCGGCRCRSRRIWRGC